MAGKFGKEIVSAGSRLGLCVSDFLVAFVVDLPAVAVNPGAYIKRAVFIVGSYELVEHLVIFPESQCGLSG